MLLKNNVLYFYREEIDHIKKIAKKVHANIAPKPFLVGESPIGLDQHVKEVKSLVQSGTVCMLGIIGLGGIGKTELAKALYNNIVHQFEAASFLANVREKSNKINGLEDLQYTLLSEMFEQPKTKFGSTNKGIDEIKKKLGKKKVLLEKKKSYVISRGWLRQRSSVCFKSYRLQFA
jgi:F0F1-type ATP synthase beta subunit